MRDALLSVAGYLAQVTWRFLPDGKKRLGFPGSRWYDFTTPEYEVFEDIQDQKWESTRGVGHSFGANRNERPEDLLSTAELVSLFCDIVSKNGNLLIGIGPNEHGVIPEEQALPLRGLGDWLSRNGEAIYATRPWDRASTVASDGTEVRFTTRDGVLYALLLNTPVQSRISIIGVEAASVLRATLLGADEDLSHGENGGHLELEFPRNFPESAAYAIRLGSGVRWIGE